MQVENHKAHAYAKALHEIAAVNASVDTIAVDLNHLISFIDKTPAVREFLAKTDITAPGKQAALADLLGNQLHPVVIAFVSFMAASAETHLLHQMVKAFMQMRENNQQIAIGELHAAIPLSPQRITEIEREVGLALNRKVSLQLKIMNNILGGIRVSVGDTVIDGTLDTQLEQARKQLAN